MTKIIEIKSCRECPHHDSDRDYTEDSFEFCTKWICNHKDGPAEPVRRYVDTFDKEDFIPNTCPLADK